MRKLMVLAAGIAACLFVGCGLIDAATGVRTLPDGSVVADAGGGVAGSVSRTLEGMPGWLGLIGTALGLGVAGYQKVRRKTAEQATASIVTGVDAALSHGTAASVAKDALYSAIQAATNAKADNPEAVAAMIARIKAAERPVVA